MRFVSTFALLIFLAACSDKAPLSRTERSLLLADETKKLGSTEGDEITVGRLEASLGHHDAAVRHFETAAATEKSSKTANRHLCLEYNLLGQWAKAVENCTESLTKDPKPSFANNALRYAKRELASDAPTLLNSGLKAYSENKWNEAIRSWLQIPSDSPLYAIAQNDLASAYILLKDFDRARKAIDEALKIEPQNPLFRNNLRWLERASAMGN